MAKHVVVIEESTFPNYYTICSEVHSTQCYAACRNGKNEMVDFTETLEVALRP